MKKVALISLVIILTAMGQTFEVQAQKVRKNSAVAPDKIEVYYFHYTRRCITCNAVEDVTKKTLAELYPEQQKNKVITFTSVNLDDDSGIALAKKCKADGQALIVMKKGKRIDLTDKGFMYAKSKPEKLKEELKTTIDALL